MFCNTYKQDICNCYMYLFSNKEDLKNYEETLLEKCFDNSYEEFNLGNTQVYNPPFIYNVIN